MQIHDEVFTEQLTWGRVRVRHIGSRLVTTIRFPDYVFANCIDRTSRFFSRACNYPEKWSSNQQRTTSCKPKSTQAPVDASTRGSAYGQSHTRDISSPLRMCNALCVLFSPAPTARFISAMMPM